MKKRILLLLTLLVTLNSFAQIEEPVEWSTSVEKISETKYKLITKIAHFQWGSLCISTTLYITRFMTLSYLYLLLVFRKSPSDPRVIRRICSIIKQGEIVILPIRTFLRQFKY